MDEHSAQTKLLAQTVYEIRLLLGNYLGSTNTEDPCARLAAHLSYAVHNEALAVVEGKSFDVALAIEKIKAIDKMFGESMAKNFELLISNEKT